jgi:hypothetical protein
MYSYKNEIHSSCFNLREKINKHNTSGVKKKTTFCQHDRVGTVGQTVLLSAASSCAASDVRMSTTVKHHATGTVKYTVPYKDFCIFFINWGMATDIKLTDYILYKYKERIKEKRTHFVICYRYYQVAIGGAAVPQCLYASRPCLQLYLHSPIHLHGMVLN